MIKFPILKPNEVAILFAEAATGHVLDTQYRLRLRDDQETFLICEDYEAADSFARRLIQERPDIECCLYDQQGTFFEADRHAQCLIPARQAVFEKHVN